jgi:hypothetical protein
VLCVVLGGLCSRFKNLFLSSISKICMCSYSLQYRQCSWKLSTQYEVYIEILLVISRSFSLSVIAGIFVADSATFTSLVS